MHKEEQPSIGLIPIHKGILSFHRITPWNQRNKIVLMFVKKQFVLLGSYEDDTDVDDSEDGFDPNLIHLSFFSGYVVRSGADHWFME